MARTKRKETGIKGERISVGEIIKGFNVIATKQQKDIYWAEQPGHQDKMLAGNVSANH